MSEPKSPRKKTATVLTVGQMIDTAFGSLNMNIVNFKMLQTVVVLLARQLRVLNRQVVMETDCPLPISDTTILISEMKLKGSAKKKNLGPRNIKSVDPESDLKLSMSQTMFLQPDPSAGSAIGLQNPPSTLWSSGLPSAEVSETALKNIKYYQLLEKIEEQRERVLRVINQRKDSHDQGVLSPSPMTSMVSTEAEFEKLLIVENILSEKSSRKCLPLVTRDIFDNLAQNVRDLQQRLDGGNFGSAEFPDNVKLMQDLRKGASLTDAMAILQISARLEAAEKTLQRIALLVGDTGDYKGPKKSKPSKDESTVTTDLDQNLRKSIADKLPMQFGHYVTKEELESSLQSKQSEVIGKVNAMIKKVATLVDENTKQSRKLEMTLGTSVNLKEKIEDLELSIITTNHHFSTLDTGLTSQMTNLQEQLTQVQLDLESGLQNMAESLATKGVDTEMITDLDRNFTNLQIDIERTGAIQKDIIDHQKKLAFEINRLKYEVELLRDIKCDRDEVEDALRDKAGIKDLNGLVTSTQFEATTLDFKKEIEGAYTTFRKQETTWQKALSDMFSQIDEKVDLFHLEGLRDKVCEKINKIKSQVDCISRILGEPLAASVTRRIHRDTTCLSCANPAHIMPLDADGFLPPVNQLTTSGETRTMISNIDRNTVLPPCVPGLKVTHTRDPRAEMCTRYCGGSHTKKRPGAIHTVTMRLEGKPLQKPDVTATFGIDGKIYQIEDEVLQEPCIPCNQEYGAGEGAHRVFENKTKRMKTSIDSSSKNSTAENCHCDGVVSIPRPSVPPMMD